MMWSVLLILPASLLKRGILFSYYHHSWIFFLMLVSINVLCSPQHYNNEAVITNQPMKYLITEAWCQTRNSIIRSMGISSWTASWLEGHKAVSPALFIKLHPWNLVALLFVKLTMISPTAQKTLFHCSYFQMLNTSLKKWDFL